MREIVKYVIFRTGKALTHPGIKLLDLVTAPDSPDRREVVRRVVDHYRANPGLTEREKLDAVAKILTDYYLEQQRGGRKVVM